MKTQQNLSKIKAMLVLLAFCFGTVALNAQTCDKKTAEKKPCKVTMLFKGTLHGKLEAVKKAVEDGADVNFQFQNGQTALTQASSKGKTEVVKYLLEKGADIEKPNKWKAAPLYIACKNKQAQTAMYLIKAGADIHKKDEYGMDAFSWACHGKNADLITVLVEKGANVNHKDQSGYTPLLRASWFGHPAVVNILLEKGAEVNYAVENGNTALHGLSRVGNPKAIKIALNYGADANMLNEMNQLPIHIAAKEQKHQAVELLMSPTKDLYTKENKYGHTPMHYSAIAAQYKTMKLYIDKGIDMNIKNNDNKTPLDYAVQYGNVNLVSLLIENKIGDPKDLAETKENKMLVNNPVQSGDARVVYTGHSGWIVQTDNAVLVFDYWSKGASWNKCLANGTFCNKEMKDKEVYVFVSHAHGDHYDTVINKWATQVNNINYIYGFDPNTAWVNKKTGYHGPEFVQLENNTTKQVKNIKVTALKSNDTGQGFLVEVNGISVYHPGDHAWFSADDEEVFKKEVDFISTVNRNVDIAFMPVSGCPNRWKPEYIVQGYNYSMEKLNPKQVYLMHGSGREYAYKEFVEQNDLLKTAEIHTVDNRGDYNTYSPNNLVKR
ncbi:ankyrin repeat domain-containing protein [Bacteroidales bacterium]|nr:ankyrin repeat domain-containing protein [Bacteroidales bacterium]